MLMQFIPRTWLFHSPIQPAEKLFVIFSRRQRRQAFGRLANPFSRSTAPSHLGRPRFTANGGKWAICVGIGVATVGVGGAVCAVVVAGLGSAVGVTHFLKWVNYWGSCL